MCCPALCLYIYCEDGASALDWLAKAFWFRERMGTMPGPA